MRLYEGTRTELSSLLLFVHQLTHGLLLIRADDRKDQRALIAVSVLDFLPDGFVLFMVYVIWSRTAHLWLGGTGG